MLYFFPPHTFATVIVDYDRPYEDPIRGKAGDVLTPDLSRTTDYLGWTWCTASDGRSGWAPTAWCERLRADAWRLERDFSALELTVRKGDRLRLLHSESGFVFCETAEGASGWVPDAVLTLDA